jgi:hypothetical protein
MPVGLRRITVGFKGGQVLALRVSDDQLEGLYGALERGGWREVVGEEGPVRINVDQVVYVGAESEELRVGFA